MQKSIDIDYFKSAEYFDVHTHMHDNMYIDNADEEMQRILDKKVAIISIGTDKTESDKARLLASKYRNVLYTVGFHPHDNLSESFDEDYYSKFTSDAKCVAIGECGLDYYYLNSDKESGKIQNIDDDIDRQREEFIKQIKFAIKYARPLMLHGSCSDKDEIDNPLGMDAYEDMLDILEKFYTSNPIESSKKANGNVHFFVGDINIARRFMNIGFAFSFGGVLTLTREYDEVLRFIPLEYLHAETDSPYVTPKGADGKRVAKINSSYYIDIIVNKISEIKNIELETLKLSLKNNFIRDFVN